MNIISQIFNRSCACAVIAMMVLTTVLASCGEEPQPGEPGVEEESGLFLELNVGFDPVSGGRADADQTKWTRGTDFENTIKSLTLFVLDASGNIKQLDIDQTTHPAVLPFTATPDRTNLILMQDVTGVMDCDKDYTIYAAANLSEKQKTSFKAELTAGTPYTIPGRHLNIVMDLTSDAYGMAMMCIEQKKMRFTVDNPTVWCSFTLKRVVSKVLVTCKANGENAVVTAKDSEDSPRFKIRLEDVSYTINSINKQTYLFQQTPSETSPWVTGGDPYVKDPNETIGSYSQDPFLYNEIESWVNLTDYFKPVKAYDGSKFPHNTDATYAESIFYCPENTFKVEDGADETLAKKQATHIIVRAKIIPLSFWVPIGLYNHGKTKGVDPEILKIIKKYEDLATRTDIYIIRCSSQYSPYIFELALDYENYTKAVSETTFFKEDGSDDLYTYSAAKIKAQGAGYQKGSNNTLDLENFKVFSDGYANYEIFIEDDDYTPAAWGYGWKRSQFLRNTYYQVVIDEFRTPGQGMDPSKKYIEVHTDIVKFNPSYKGVINIDDETQTTCD